MLEIRPYRGADFDVLVSRWHETNLATFTYLATEQRHTLDDARAFFRESIVATSEIWVAEEQGKLMGLIALSGNWIRQLSVFPEFQRRGVGTRLLQTTKEMGLSELRLYTLQRNRPARTFYEQRGFRAIAFGTSPPPENEPDVQYLWQSPRPAAP